MAINIDQASALSTYEHLAARFDTHATRKQGGVDLIYLTGEQVISRMNDVLGPTGWSFRVVSQGTTDTEAWVLGELVATIDGMSVVRQQYGNQDLARGQHATTDLFKAACTDAIKKAATTIGVGLYLYDADERRAVQAEMRVNQGQPARAANAPTPINRQNSVQTSAAESKAPMAVSPNKPEPTSKENARARELVGERPTLIANLAQNIRQLRELGLEMSMPKSSALQTMTDDDLRAQIETTANGLAEAKK